MMRSASVLGSIVALCLCAAVAAQVPPPKGPSISLVEEPASLGAFQQAYALTFSVLSTKPPDDVVAKLRRIYERYPQILRAGLQHANRAIANARTEKDLINAQAEVRGFAKLQAAGLADVATLVGLQARYVVKATALILDGAAPITFESNLFADWLAATGREMDAELGRRIYENTMANLATNLASSTPSEIAVTRLCRYLQRNPTAQAEALERFRKIEWPVSALAGPIKTLYPEFAEERLKGLAPTGVESGEAPWDSPLQFDTKGVEFGPWVRRFLSQVRRNWFVPYEAMSLRGHVSVAFTVHRNGNVSDVVVAVPSTVESFNAASFKAIAASNPTVALPPEYPDEKATITITFFYNETPPQKR